MRLAATHFVEVFETMNKEVRVSNFCPIYNLSQCLHVSRVMRFKTIQVWKIKLKENANQEKRELPEGKK